MRFRYIPGKNFKTYVFMSDLETKKDFEMYEIVKSVLTRTEYKPFVTGFNKNLTFSYLINDYIFPAQFWHDVIAKLSQLYQPEDFVLENEDQMYKNDVSRESFDEYIAKLPIPEDFEMDAEEYKYQQDAVFFSIQNGIGRVEIATSGGKTFITYLYCRFLFDNVFQGKKRILVVVPSQFLCKQLKSDFAEYDKQFERHLTVETIFSGAKKLIDADIVCGTYQSLALYDADYFEDFGVFICDEVHRAKAYSIKNEIFAKLLNCEYFFGMTGTTPDYKTLDYLHIVSMFGHRLVYVTAKELIESSVATPVEVVAVEIEYIEEKDFSINLIADGIIGVEKYRLEKIFFQNNEKRTNLIAKLLNHYIDNTLILVDTVEYCQILKDYMTKHCEGWIFEIIHGEIKKERDAIIQGMKDSEDHYCIIATYGTMATGVSIKNLVNLFFPDGGKSEIRIRQSIGRGMRLFFKKKLCRVFDFQDKMKKSAFKNHAYERNKIYRAQGFPVKIAKVAI